MYKRSVHLEMSITTIQQGTSQAKTDLVGPLSVTILTITSNAHMKVKWVDVDSDMKSLFHAGIKINVQDDYVNSSILPCQQIVF